MFFSLLELLNSKNFKKTTTKKPMQIKIKKPQNEAERINWIKLARSENIGPITFFRLLEIFGSAELAIEKMPEFIAQVGVGKKVKICPQRDVENEIAALKKFGAEMLLFTDEDYPRLVREIYDPAIILTVFGRKELLNQDLIGVVGPRNATFHACKFAEKVALDLGEQNITIVSGLARGVDAAAHRGSLKTGTVAVIAGGIGNIYPAENSALYQQIYKEGALVSEAPFGSMPRGGNFIQRNRIISGMSYGVVVVEAGMQSGSLTTARFAIEQGRDVFAVPGSPMDPRCLGSNMLLEDGAIFTQGANRIIKEISGMRARFAEGGKLEEPEAPGFSGPEPKIPSDTDLKKVRDEILQRMGFSTISIEDIIIETNAPARLVHIALVQLELAGVVTVNAGRVVRC